MSDPAAPPAPFASAKAAGYVPDDDERRLASYAHLFGAFALVLGCSSGLHLIGPLVPMFMAKQPRGPFLLFHVNQSFWLQAELWFVNGVVALLVGLLGSVTCGVGWVLWAVNAALLVAAFAYPIVVGMKTKNGAWAEYAWIGRRALADPRPFFT